MFLSFPTYPLLFTSRYHRPGPVTVVSNAPEEEYSYSNIHTNYLAYLTIFDAIHQ